MLKPARILGAKPKARKTQVIEFEPDEDSDRQAAFNEGQHDFISGKPMKKKKKFAAEYKDGYRSLPVREVN